MGGRREWTLQLLHLAPEVYHFKRGLGSLGAFVAYGTSLYAVNGLLLVFDRKHAEYHRGIAVGVESRYALSHAVSPRTTHPNTITAS